MIANSCSIAIKTMVSFSCNVVEVLLVVLTVQVIIIYTIISVVPIAAAVTEEILVADVQ